MIVSLVAVVLASTAPTEASPPAPTTTSAPVKADSLVIEDAWIRLPPPGATMFAGYLRMKNPGDVALQVVGAQTSVSARAELHTHLKVDGVMKMRPVPVIDVPAHGEVTLAPGGLHLMLMEPKRTPTEGELIDVVLTLKDGRVVPCRAAVRREAPSSSSPSPSSSISPSPSSSSSSSSSPSATPHHHH
jgi:copper(I)-binding protein